jgi:serine protease Do
LQEALQFFLWRSSLKTFSVSAPRESRSDISSSVGMSVATLGWRPRNEAMVHPVDPKRLAACCLLAAALSACSEQPQEARPPPKSSPFSAAPPAAPTPQAPTSGGGSTLAGPPDFTALVRKEGPAVVNVTTVLNARRGEAQLRDDPLFDFFRRFMPNPPEGEREFRAQGLGSGFIISPDGFVLTNAHVVAEAAEVTVRLADSKREFKANVIGLDRRTDIALLKLAATGLPTATLGNSQNLAAGEWVVAIGSPFGFENTITAGIVSAKGRSLPDESFVPFIQTDVAVNPGNSGGPLLNSRGEVVGINSQIYSRTGGYMGVSFAIPIEVALDVARELQAHGTVVRGRLGVRIAEVTQGVAESLRLGSPRGVLIAAVERGGPADRAGLAPGDVILSYNGKTIENPNELPRLVAATKPGTQATLDIWRKGATRQLNAIIGELPRETPAPTVRPSAAPAARPSTAPTVRASAAPTAAEA